MNDNKIDEKGPKYKKGEIYQSHLVEVGLGSQGCPQYYVIMEDSNEDAGTLKVCGLTHIEGMAKLKTEGEFESINLAEKGFCKAMPNEIFKINCSVKELDFKYLEKRYQNYSI